MHLWSSVRSVRDKYLPGGHTSVLSVHVVASFLPVLYVLMGHTAQLLSELALVT